MEHYFLGIDIGTQGARAILINTAGEVILSGEKSFSLSADSRQEQSPDMWWNTCRLLLKNMLKSSVTGKIVSVAVTSTSGTVIPLDKNNFPLHPAIMYSDKRSSKEGALCSAKAKEHVNGYTGFNASSGISKMVWFANNFPEVIGDVRRWVHAADFITGKLTGIWGVTDHTNALKSGYDTVNEEWPEYLFHTLDLKKEWLPDVFPAGQVIGKMDPSLASSLGLREAPNVTVGITDGCASQIASGAIKPGDWNSTIGTTLVVKGVTTNQIHDPLGRFYSHKHPEGYWMPGGASNTGADWITQDYADDLENFERKASALIPTDHLSYPLMQAGERFPFIASHAKGFGPESISKEEKFTSSMEGVAYIERYAYEVAKKLSGEDIQGVYSAGGGSLSPTWLKIRSNVMKLPVYKMQTVSGAFGAAVLAASQTFFDGLTDAGNHLIQLEKEIFPDEKLSQTYDSHYRSFIEILKEKNYINDKNYA